jgi:ankyrin
MTASPVVQCLLALGAEVNCGNKQRVTPLHYATRRGDIVSTRLLLECGADREQSTGSKATALHFAAAGGFTDVIELLLHGQSSQTANDGMPARKYISEMSAEVRNPQDSQGQTPLSTAVLNDRVDVVELLLREGADPKSRDSQGYTADDIARMQGTDPSLLNGVLCVSSNRICLVM